MNRIRINNLFKDYSGNLALNNINVEIEQGKIYALLGHNGAGKTTLIKNILKLDLSYKGKIEYDIDNVSDKSLHKYFTYSPELYYLFEDLTILEYFEFVKKAYCINEESNIFELIKIFDLEEKLNNFISTLSNGMKKKVSLIAAFFPNTPFRILDEPFSGLDPIAIYNLKKYIKDTFKKRTYIISTHQLAILDSINIPSQDVYLVLMNKGEVVFNGSKEQLLYDDKYKNIEQAYISLIEGGQ